MLQCRSENDVSLFGQSQGISHSDFLHEVVFSNLTVIVLPAIFGIRGVWYSFLLSNIMMFFITLYAIYVNRDNYGYGKKRECLSAGLMFLKRPFDVSCL